jgi:hypothetical protein
MCFCRCVVVGLSSYVGGAHPPYPCPFLHRGGGTPTPSLISPYVGGEADSEMCLYIKMSWVFGVFPPPLCRGGLRWGTCARLQPFLHHIFYQNNYIINVFPDFCIVKTQHQNILCRKVTVSVLIIQKLCIFPVVPAVKFYRKTCRCDIKVKNVWPHAVLPAHLYAQRFILHVSPQFLFIASHLFSQCTSVRFCFCGVGGVHGNIIPHPSPPLHRGGGTPTPPQPLLTGAVPLVDILFLPPFQRKERDHNLSHKGFRVLPAL